MIEAFGQQTQTQISNDQELELSLLHTTMSKNITITYELHPPSGIEPNGLSSSKIHEFSVASEGSSGSKYYDALRQSVVQAKTTLGEELTAWKDAVGTKELTKEPKKPKDEDDDEEDDEEANE